MTVNDNFGMLFALLIRSPSTGTLNTGTIFRDTGNTLRQFVIFALGVNFTFNFTGNGAGVSKSRVGKGTTPPTRQDFNVDSGFPDSPESSLISSVTPTYNSGLAKITQATLISPTGGSGTISEVIKTARWSRAISLGGDFCIARDLNSPVSNFIVGQSINIDHEVFI